MKPAKTTIRPTEMQCPHCKAAMQFVRRIDLNELPKVPSSVVLEFGDAISGISRVPGQAARSIG